MSSSTSPVSNQALSAASNLDSPEKRSIFLKENGYTPPFSLANPETIENLASAVHQFAQRKKTVKFSILSSPYGDRKAHIFSKLVFDVATDTAILETVSSYLGQDILMWLGQVITRKPKNKGKIWHIDQINWEVDGIHASVAITDMTQANGCLQVIPKTHLYNISQKELEAEAKLADVSLWNGEAMVALADRLHPENAPHQLVSLEVKAGQTFFTKGGLWHGVTRSTSDQPRSTLVARYMRPDVTGKDAGQPLRCILVAGTDTEHKNPLCSLPQPWFKQDILLNYRLNKLLGKVANLIRK